MPATTHRRSASLWKLFLPDHVCQDIYELTPALLERLGIRGLILDIDNTLVTYDDEVPTPRLLAWLAALKHQGIRVAFASNNKPQRVRVFNASLGYFAVSRSHKPSRKALRRALNAMGTSSADTLAVGDQIFTDILAARRLGLRCVLVPPIRDKQSFFVRLKRLLERPFIRCYRRRGSLLLPAADA